jgi:hypothetical protein
LMASILPPHLGVTTVIPKEPKLGSPTQKKGQLKISMTPRSSTHREVFMAGHALGPECLTLPYYYIYGASLHTFISSK